MRDIDGARAKITQRIVICRKHEKIPIKIPGNIENSRSLLKMPVQFPYFITQTHQISHNSVNFRLRGPIFRKNTNNIYFRMCWWKKSLLQIGSESPEAFCQQPHFCLRHKGRNLFRRVVKSKRLPANGTVVYMREDIGTWVSSFAKELRWTNIQHWNGTTVRIIWELYRLNYLGCKLFKNLGFLSKWKIWWDQWILEF